MDLFDTSLAKALDNMAPRRCPFCIAKVKAIGKVDVGDDEHRFVVVCELCGAQGPTAKKEQAAVRLWNNRLRVVED
jgi:Lar family restriction alleviation protein